MSGPQPDFETLRAARNQRVLDLHQKLADEWGVDLTAANSTFDPQACYCACPDGPCEHTWDGKMREGAYGSISVTCSRCGCTAIGHDLRVMP